MAQFCNLLDRSNDSATVDAVEKAIQIILLDARAALQTIVLQIYVFAIVLSDQLLDLEIVTNCIHANVVLLVHNLDAMVQTKTASSKVAAKCTVNVRAKGPSFVE